MYGIRTQIQRTFIGVAVLMIVLCTTSVACRFYSRHLKNVPYAIDDWLLLAGLFFFLVEMGVHLIGPIAAGVGQHIQNVSTDEFVLAFEALIHVEWIYTVAFTFVRFSILTLFVRVFVMRWFRIACYATMGLCMAWCVFIFIYIFASCTPFSAHYDGTVLQNCWPQNPYYYAVGAGGIACNLCIWILPQFVVWKLQMPLKQKFGVAALFALGAFDIAVEAIRLAQLYYLTISKDLTYDAAPVEIWSFLEVGVCILLASLPMCRPVWTLVVHRTLPKSFLSYASKGKMTSSEGRTGGDEDYNQLFRDDGAFGKTEASATVLRDLSSVDSLGAGRTDSDKDYHEAISVQRDITVTEQRDFLDSGRAV